MQQAQNEAVKFQEQGVKDIQVVPKRKFSRAKTVSAQDAPLTVESFFYNTKFTRENMKALQQKQDNLQEFQDYILYKILDIKPDTEIQRQQQIYLEFLMSVYKFAMVNKFSLEKQSTIFSIVNFTFVESLEQKLTSTEAYQIFKTILSRHSKQCMPFSMGVFSDMDCKEIIAFMKRTFFKHYSMWEVILTQFIDYNIMAAPSRFIRFPSCDPLQKGVIVNPLEQDELLQYFSGDVSSKLRLGSSAEMNSTTLLEQLNLKQNTDEGTANENTVTATKKDQSTVNRIQSNTSSGNILKQPLTIQDEAEELLVEKSYDISGSNVLNEERIKTIEEVYVEDRFADLKKKVGNQVGQMNLEIDEAIENILNVAKLKKK